MATAATPKSTPAVPAAQKPASPAPAKKRVAAPVGGTSANRQKATTPKVALPVKRAAAASKAVPKAAPKVAPKAAPKVEPKADKGRVKLVRDSFTMPPQDFGLIAELKQRAMDFKRPTKKSELLRAGLQVLAALSQPKLQQVLGQLAPLKTGRPKKHG